MRSFGTSHGAEHGQVKPEEIQPSHTAVDQVSLKSSPGFWSLNSTGDTEALTHRSKSLFILFHRLLVVAVVATGLLGLNCSQ